MNKKDWKIGYRDWTPERLLFLRSKAKLSLKDAASGCGLGVQSLSNYEKGSSKPGINELVKLSDFYGVSIDYLIGRCSEEVETQLRTHYAAHFLEMKAEAYRMYLETGRDVKQQPVTVPYPYNLAEDVLGMERGTLRYLSEDQLKGLADALQHLNDRERDLVQRHYSGWTLEELGRKENVTRERVRQLIQRGLRKMRFGEAYKKISEGKESWALKKEAESVERKAFDLQVQKCRLESLNREVQEAEEALKAKKAEGTITKADLDPDIDDLGLSVRSYNALKRYQMLNGIESPFKGSKIAELYRSGELLEIRNLGTKSAEDVREKLQEAGYAV